MIYLRVNRTETPVVNAAKACFVSDLHEALGPIKGRMQSMSPRMRPLMPGIRMAGPAITVRPAPGDNLMMHRGLSLAKAGDVLVVAANDESGAQWGLLAALYAERLGLAGVVVHGSIRDIDALTEHRFPVWFTSISPAHPEKKGVGLVNAPVVCDGVRVCPGDLVVADGDGVIVVPRADAAATVHNALNRVTAESETVKRIAAGETLWQAHDIDKFYGSLGIQEQDRAWDDEA
jgi:4-hydroxy-4-methyl-2-oxoglutarate aldolase